MLQQEIREKITANNSIIQAVLMPNQFTLNNTVRKLLEENKKLRAQCSHKFEDGYCVYCDLEEEGDKEKND